MTAFLLSTALLALFFAWYLAADLSAPQTIRHPSESRCQNCKRQAQTGVYYDGTVLQFLCNTCHDEAESAGWRG